MLSLSHSKLQHFNWQMLSSDFFSLFIVEFVDIVFIFIFTNNVQRCKELKWDRLIFFFVVSKKSNPCKDCESLMNAVLSILNFLFYWLSIHFIITQSTLIQLVSHNESFIYFFTIYRQWKCYSENHYDKKPLFFYHHLPANMKPLIQILQ